MTICRWLTPLQNQAWINNWHQRREHKTITPQHFNQMNQVSQIVRDQDYIVRQDASRKLKQRSKAAKEASFDALRALIKSDGATGESEGVPAFRPARRLLGIVQPAGYANKSNSNYSQMDQASSLRQRGGSGSPHGFSAAARSNERRHMNGAQAAQMRLIQRLPQRKTNSLTYVVQSLPDIAVAKPRKSDEEYKTDESRQCQSHQSHIMLSDLQKDSKHLCSSNSAFVQSNAKLDSMVATSELLPSQPHKRLPLHSQQTPQNSTLWPSSSSVSPQGRNDVSSSLSSKRTVEHHVPPTAGLNRRKQQLQKSKFAPQPQRSSQRVSSQANGSDCASRTSEQISYEFQLRQKLSRFQLMQADLSANPQQAERHDGASQILATQQQWNQQERSNRFGFPHERTGCSLSSTSDDGRNNSLQWNFCKVPMAEAIPSHKAKLQSYNDAGKDGVPYHVLNVTHMSQCQQRVAGPSNPVPLSSPVRQISITSNY